MICFTTMSICRILFHNTLLTKYTGLALMDPVLVLRLKGGTAQPPTEEFLASFCFSNLAFLFKFQWGMHCLSIALVVEFHSLSIIGFMTDLFSFSFFSLFLPGSGSCFTVDFKLYCKLCSAKYCLTLK